MCGGLYKREGGWRRLRNVWAAHPDTQPHMDAGSAWTCVNAAGRLAVPLVLGPGSTHIHPPIPSFANLFRTVATPPRLATPPYHPTLISLFKPTPLLLGLQRDTCPNPQPTRHPAKYNSFITSLLTSFFFLRKINSVKKKMECKQSYNLFLTIPNLFTEE